MTYKEYCGSIECLKVVGQNQAWTVILEQADLIGRSNSAITAVSDTKIAVYGGYRSEILSSGYILDAEENHISPILDSQVDFAFSCRSMTYPAGKGRFVSLGSGDQ